MKFGMRKPSLKRSIKARTTGRVKRQLKSTVNPMYGKKGIGYINDPKKAVYNKVYNKTTVGVHDLANGNTGRSTDYAERKEYSSSTTFVLSAVLFVLGIILLIMSVMLFLIYKLPGVMGIILAVLSIRYARHKMKESKKKMEIERTEQNSRME